MYTYICMYIYICRRRRQDARKARPLRADTLYTHYIPTCWIGIQVSVCVLCGSPVGPSPPVVGFLRVPPPVLTDSLRAACSSSFHASASPAGPPSLWYLDRFTRRGADCAPPQVFLWRSHMIPNRKFRLVHFVYDMNVHVCKVGVCIKQAKYEQNPALNSSLRVFNM